MKARVRRKGAVRLTLPVAWQPAARVAIAIRRSSVASPSWAAWRERDFRERPHEEHGRDAAAGIDGLWRETIQETAVIQRKPIQERKT
jgi:hypothetical protein